VEQFDRKYPALARHETDRASRSRPLAAARQLVNGIVRSGNGMERT
jgi:hypothetical protein